MMRDIKNRSLLGKDVVESSMSDIQPQANYCPLPPRGGDIPELNETESLIVQYKRLVAEIRAIRGKLYRLGIDPEKY